MRKVLPAVMSGLLAASFSQIAAAQPEQAGATVIQQRGTQNSSQIGEGNQSTQVYGNENQATTQSGEQSQSNTQSGSGNTAGNTVQSGEQNQSAVGSGNQQSQQSGTGNSSKQDSTWSSRKIEFDVPRSKEVFTVHNYEGAYAGITTLAAYLENEWTLSDRLSVRAGLRTLTARRLGTTLMPRIRSTAGNCSSRRRTIVFISACACAASIVTTRPVPVASSPNASTASSRFTTRRRPT